MKIEHLWQQILPASIYCSVGSLDGNFLPLTHAELDSVGLVSTKRLIELEAGRTLARSALAKVEINCVDIVKAQLTGAPVWPASIVGSITHSSNSINSHVAVVVAKKNEISLLGADAELGGSIHPSLWDLFLCEDELNWVNAKPVIEKSLLVRKIWSLKEAAIKASGYFDMLRWRVNQKESNTDVFELIFSGETGDKSFTGKAICRDNITLAVVYAECNSGSDINS